MKFNIKNNSWSLAVLLLCAVFVAGCQEGDGHADQGFGYIYIPNATVSGGLNNHYNVPDGAAENTYNFNIQNGKLHIYLGVLRSGKISNASGFTVDVAVSSAQTEEAIASQEISHALAMPSGLYTLPDKVTVDSGKNTGSFFLSVDLNALLTDTYAGKKLVLAVEIKNPTHYELAGQYTSVVVIVDVDEIQEFVAAQ